MTKWTHSPTLTMQILSWIVIAIHIQMCIKRKGEHQFLSTSANSNQTIWLWKQIIHTKGYWASGPKMNSHILTMLQSTQFHPPIYFPFGKPIIFIDFQGSHMWEGHNRMACPTSGKDSSRKFPECSGQHGRCFSQSPDCSLWWDNDQDGWHMPFP